MVRMCEMGRGEGGGYRVGEGFDKASGNKRKMVKNVRKKERKKKKIPWSLVSRTCTCDWSWTIRASRRAVSLGLDI